METGKYSGGLTYKEAKKLLGREGVLAIADKHKITLDRAYLILRERIKNHVVLMDMYAEAIRRKAQREKMEKQILPDEGR
jgi:hypothetical protein